MNKEQTILSAIKQAEGNGLTMFKEEYEELIGKWNKQSFERKWEDIMPYDKFLHGKAEDISLSPHILFSKEYRPLVKALFGERKIHCNCYAMCEHECGCDVFESGWEINLQQLVISEDPIEYISNYLNK